MVFVIHWNELAMDLHVFPISILPPTSHYTRSLWVFPVTPVLLPGKFHRRRSLMGSSYSPWGGNESEMTEWLHFFLYKGPRTKNADAQGQKMGVSARTENKSTLLCLWFIQALSELDDTHSSWWGKSSLSSLLTQMLISSGNTLTDKPRNNVSSAICTSLSLVKPTFKINHHMEYIHHNALRIFQKGQLYHALPRILGVKPWHNWACEVLSDSRHGFHWNIIYTFMTASQTNKGGWL